MSNLPVRLEAEFFAHFGSAPLHIVKAPGRVNLIGEHTDYNEGFVLPCAIDYHTLVAISPRNDQQVEALAIDWQGQSDSFSLTEDISFNSEQMWCNYIRGVVNEMQTRGHSVTGCNIALTGNIPQGAGLSSSASLEVGTAYAIAKASEINLALPDIARIGQAAENQFVGCACGIMDQLISACGQAGFAIKIDCRDLALTSTPIPPGLSLLIIDSNVKRGLVDSEYNQRRRQCEDAASFFGKKSLRDVNLEEFRTTSQELDPQVAKRALHIIEENQRVLDTVKAFQDGDIVRISDLMADSHRSMKELFEITTPEIDLLVDIVHRVIGSQGGVRMTGGGFGGCVVVLLPAQLIDKVVSAVAEQYQSKTGLRESVYQTRPANGVELLY